jgi:hypothetical protein
VLHVLIRAGLLAWSAIVLVAVSSFVMGAPRHYARRVRPDLRSPIFQRILSCVLAGSFVGVLAGIGLSVLGLLISALVKIWQNI